ncbi:MAG TPA: DUF1499 domain-containing protein [Paracoccaceae bacterium]|nr:DUF1499 domain-containing protein [Paracoccaceae bacterium]
MRRILVAILALLVVLAGAGAVWIRTVSHEPVERWHVDPLTVPDPATQNFHRVGPAGLSPSPAHAAAPVYRAEPSELARAFDDMAMRQPDTLRLAGSPEEGWMTYVQRTRIMKFPDYISVKVIGLGEGRSTLAIFSRSRFGTRDMGVNEARVKSWLQALKPLEE